MSPPPRPPGASNLGQSLRTAAREASVPHSQLLTSNPTMGTLVSVEETEAQRAQDFPKSTRSQARTQVPRPVLYHTESINVAKSDLIGQ